jgi:hypothetical protein
LKHAPGGLQRQIIAAFPKQLSQLAQADVLALIKKGRKAANDLVCWQDRVQKH